MAKIKAILPSLREKKRYLAFEVLSKSRIKGFSGVSKAVWQGMLSFNGTRGVAQAGIWLLPEKYNAETQKGIIRVNNKHVDSLKAGLATIQEIEGVPAIVRSIGVSGSLKKATTYTAG
ncbi:MAG: Rpp14/Pop5 family protein [Candidatus Woesearchaeota archaeon]